MQAELEESQRTQELLKTQNQVQKREIQEMEKTHKNYMEGGEEDAQNIKHVKSILMRFLENTPIT